MVLVWQIVIALVVLIGLITIIMSVKNWHWAQMLLLLGIFFSGLAVLILGLEVYRIHRNLRAGMPAKERLVEQMEEVNQAFRHGTRNPEVISRAMSVEPLTGEPPYDAEAEGGHMPSLDSWQNRLQDQARDRGRVWRGVKAAGPVDPATGRIPVTIAAPQPHGLGNGALVFMFEQGPPNAAAPDQGRQYLGEFRVVESAQNGVTLESVHKLDNRTGNRLVRSGQNPQHSWSLYETMPPDSHELFAGKSEEELKQLLPGATISEYLRHGTPPTPDDDEHHRAAFDDEGKRVALDDAEKTEERYDRQLRDYAYLIAELMRQRALINAERAGLAEDNARLTAANENALKLTAHREKELVELEKDRQFMERDQQVIEKLRDTVLAQLANAGRMVAELIPLNAQLARQLIEFQTSRVGEFALPADGSLVSAPAP